jgi:serine/threonine-protein kinase RIO1
MHVTLVEKIGSGGFASVWRGKDDLDRDVAIKILGPSAAQMMGAYEHARPLARVNHSNVVRVYAVETIPNPEGEGAVECVIMEYVPGPTLAERVSQGSLSLEEVRDIGTGIIAALEAIHAAGIAHRDLHAENVILGPDGVKVIDVFYRGTLANLPTLNRQATLRDDISQLVQLLSFGLRNSELKAEAVDEFHRISRSQPVTFENVRVAFVSAIESEDTELALRKAEEEQGLYNRFIEDGFVEGSVYAKALAEQTPQALVAPLLQRIVREGSYQNSRSHFVRNLWDRLTNDARIEIISLLASKLDAETPAGKYSPHIRIIRAFGREGWDALPVTTRLRLERLVLEDLKQGQKDVYGLRLLPKGTLGTYVNVLWPFLNREALIDILSQKLRSSWYTQNYVGEFFMGTLSRLATTPEHQQKLIDALRVACQNDAFTVKSKLRDLPAEWQAQLVAMDDAVEN